MVVLDISLPGMSGLEVFAELRRIRPDVKVILTTAYQETAVPAVSGQQAWAFVRKPYQINDLVNPIRAACVEKKGSGRAETNVTGPRARYRLGS